MAADSQLNHAAHVAHVDGNAVGACVLQVAEAVVLAAAGVVLMEGGLGEGEGGCQGKMLVAKEASFPARAESQQ